MIMAKAATAQKTTAKAPPPPTREVVKGKKQEVDQAQLDEINKMLRENTGKGLSTAMEDNTVPLIYILQALSPQVNKKKEEYIDGAEAGMIWFRGSKEIVSGEDGIPVVPVYWSKCWVEWMPDRGGFVGRHEDRPPQAVLKTDPQNDKKFWQMPNGNTVVETREHVVIVLDIYDEPTAFVIPMSGSGHKSSRDWMTLMNRKKIPPDFTLKSPSYGYIYRMKLTFRTNAKGDWYMWHVTDENDETTQLSDPNILKMAIQLEKDFEKGTKKAQQLTDEGFDTEADTEDRNAANHI
jgi:hypothetical protein